MKHRHLTELLTEGRFTTVEVFFPNAQKVAKATEPRAAVPAWGTPTSGRVPYSAVSGNVLNPAEMAAMQAAFPFIGKEVPERTFVYKVSHEIAKFLHTGDSVVVPRADGQGFGIGKVWLVHESAQIDYNSDTNYKWIVQRVDAEQYNENLAREQEFTDLLERTEKARRRAEVRNALLAQLTPTDPEAFASFVNAMKLLGVENPEAVIPAPAAPVAEKA